MKKTDEWYDSFMYGSFVGIFAGVTIGFLMWGNPKTPKAKKYTKFNEKQFEFKK